MWLFQNVEFTEERHPNLGEGNKLSHTPPLSAHGSTASLENSGSSCCGRKKTKANSYQHVRVQFAVTSSHVSLTLQP